MVLVWLASSAVASDGDVLFTEDWRGGTGAWIALGDPVVIVEIASPEGTLLW